MNKKPKAAPFRIGQRLRFNRKNVEYTYFRNGQDNADGFVVLKAGIIGTVVSTHRGWTDDDSTMDDWNTIEIDGLPCRAVDVESSADWELT